MKLRNLTLSLVGLSLVGAAVGAAGSLVPTAAFAQAEQFFPMLVYRTGPYAPSGIPVANGFRDYYTLINERDGGINGGSDQARSSAPRSSCSFRSC